MIRLGFPGGPVVKVGVVLLLDILPGHGKAGVVHAPVQHSLVNLLLHITELWRSHTQEMSHTTEHWQEIERLDKLLS